MSTLLSPPLVILFLAHLLAIHPVQPQVLRAHLDPGQINAKRVSVFDRGTSSFHRVLLFWSFVFQLINSALCIVRRSRSDTFFYAGNNVSLCEFSSILFLFLILRAAS